MWVGRRRLWIAGLLLVVIAVVAFSYLGAWDRSYTIQFIIPNDYIGAFVVQEDVEQGVSPDVGQDIYSYTVPESGVLRARSLDLFEQYHFVIARYADGKPIPTLTNGGRGPGIKNTEEAALRSVISTSERKIFYSVGTLKDHREIRHRLLTPVAVRGHGG